MPRPLPRALYTAAQTRELDRLAIAGGIPGAELMERAGRAAFDLVRERWPGARRIAVLCGGGNNGGDGYVVARLAAEAGLQPVVHALVAPERLRGDALTMARRAAAAGIDIRACGDEVPTLTDADLIVDALFGTGLRGPLRPEAVPLVEAVNRASAPVLAIDIPSGLDADTGQAAGAVVRADCTITFIGVKRGLLTGAGPAFAGATVFAGLGVPPEVHARVDAGCERTAYADFLARLGPRRRDAHKGSNGHVLVVGGDHGFGGAVLMAASAAARCGAGLTTVATRPEHCAAILARQPEVMARGIATAADLDPLIARATVVVAGPGLGRHAWGEALLTRVLAASRPLVLDADALNLLASGVDAEPAGAAPVRILTPHPGEAARLLATTVAAVEADRFAAVTALSARYRATALLKGAGTLIASSGAPIAVNTSGNPGMASGGMGDVLSGVIGALLAQGLDAHDAARFGALLHGMAADHAVADDGERGLLATDLLPHLRRLVNGREE